MGSAACSSLHTEHSMNHTVQDRQRRTKTTDRRKWTRGPLSPLHLGQADDHKYDLLRFWGKNALPLVPRDPKAPLFKLLWESLPPPPKVLAALAFEVAPAYHNAPSLSMEADSIELSSGLRTAKARTAMNLQKKQWLERALELKGYWVCLCCPNPHIR